MKQSIFLFIFALFCLYKSSEANGGPYPMDFSGDANEAYLDDIDCGDDGEGISFKINIPDMDQWSDGEESQWLLVDSTASGGVCQPASFATAELVEYGPFDADECAKEITTDEANDILEVVFEVSVDTSGGEITFQYDHHYEITCRYSTKDDTLQASFLPLHSVYDSDESESGALTFGFNLYLTSSGALVTTDYTIDLETQLYGLLYVDGGGFSTLDVHFEALTATSSEGYSEELISNGCSNYPEVISGSTCSNGMYEQVDLVAFRFAGQSDSFVNALVTFEVTAIVCLPEEINNQCDIDCAICEMSSPGGALPFRKRRSLDVNRVKETKYYLKAGPYKFSNVNKKNQQGADDVDDGDSSTFPTYLVAILVVSVVVAIAIVSAAVVIVLRKRRRNATLGESSSADESSTGPV